ncbi:pyridoxal kinase [Oryzibacter oryziterrae]|uniref:pyridoxal kinase n=1 Tax=Oryzibacter oryziterrae TaxID=2766474 RepID=UPI001EFFE0D1|nr:pyridoxal kinase [Oryzibacter oryziterrae]
MALPAVIVVSSFVARGSVGARAAFALERLGHRVWTLPTVLLPWHPGHGRAHRHNIPDDHFADLAGDLAGARWLKEVGAIMTGYFASPAQVEAAARLVAAVKAANPAALHLCDPVLGDNGSLYVPEPVAIAQRDTLLPIADLATPNRFELGWLTGRTVEDMTSLIEAARVLGPAEVVVTSAPAVMRGKIATALVNARDTLVAENLLVTGATSGSGDLFAALFVARKLAGATAEAALASAAATTFEIIARTAKAGGDELDLAAEQLAIVNPVASVDIRRFAAARARPA